MLYPLYINIVTQIPDEVAAKLNNIMPIEADINITLDNYVPVTIGICDRSFSPRVVARATFKTLSARQAVEDLVNALPEVFTDCDPNTYIQTHDSNHDEIDPLKRIPCDNGFIWEVVA